MSVCLTLVLVLLAGHGLVQGYYFDDEEVVIDDSTPDYEPYPMTNEFISDDVVIDVTRNMVKRDIQLWSGGVIPYVIDSKYPAVVKERILMAMREIEKQVNTDNRTCIRYVSRTNQRQHIYILPIGGSCHSKIGRQPSRQELSIGRGCEHKGVIMHELTHALGFWHEQARPDRDQYIQIVWDNIRPTAKGQFAIHSNTKTMNTSYDYGSIMHYRRNAFSIDHSKPTIIAKKRRPRGVWIGQRDGYSRDDVIKVQRLYGCDEDATRVVESADLDFCDFSYGSFCLLEQDKTADFDWEINQAADFAVAKAAGHKGKEARLVATINSSDAKDLCIIFSVLMQGHSGSVSVLLSGDQGGMLLKRTLHAQGSSKWNKVYATAGVYTHATYTVTFTAHLGDSDIGLDSIEMKKGHCH